MASGPASVACGARQAAGDPEQSVAAHRGGPGRGVPEADLAGPASEVVRERGDHRPRAVGGELSAGEVREGLVFEVADRELDHGVIAVPRFDLLERCGLVGRERVVTASRGTARPALRPSGCGARPAARPRAWSRRSAPPRPADSPRARPTPPRRSSRSTPGPACAA